MAKAQCDLVRISVSWVLALLCLIGCSDLRSDEVIVLEEAELRLGAAHKMPPGDDGRWRAVSLPDAWGLFRRRVAREGWYRLHFRLQALPEEPWAIYIQRASLNAAVYVNGLPVGSGGSFDEPLTRNVIRPYLFSLSPTLLRSGENRIDVRLATTPGHIGMLTPVQVGTESSLRRRHDRARFWSVSLMQILTVLAGLAALLSIDIARLTRPRSGGLWFAACFVCWTWASLGFLVRDPHMSPLLWEWLCSVALHCSIPCLVPAFHRLLDVRRPRLEITIGAANIALAALHAAVPPLFAALVDVLWLIVMCLTGLYLLALLVLFARTAAPRRAWILVLPGVLALACGIDVLQMILTGKPWLSGVAILIPLFCVLAMIWMISGQLVTSTRETQILNRELEDRVEAKHQELEANYERLREFESERAITDERSRIMRDMHDGTGGHLVSALALAEDDTATREQVTEAVRQALDDLRLMITSLDTLDDDLLQLLATLRSRVEPRLAQQGVRFDWQVTDLPTLPDFGPRKALQVLRIVQEAITNVLKHAGADTISVRTGEARSGTGKPGVFVEIRDNGCGLPSNPRRGRGLDNMLHRAKQLGGSLDLDSSAEGTSVRLWIPVDRNSEPAVGE